MWENVDREEDIDGGLAKMDEIPLPKRLVSSRTEYFDFFNPINLEPTSLSGLSRCVKGYPMIKGQVVGDRGS